MNRDDDPLWFEILAVLVVVAFFVAAMIAVNKALDQDPDGTLWLLLVSPSP